MKILYIAALIIVAEGLSAAGQERVLTEAEFTEIHTKAQADLHKGTHGPFRMVLETETNMDGRPEVAYRLKSVTMSIPGGGTHLIEDRSFGGNPSKSESISVHGRQFSRSADGTWKEIAVKPRSGDEPTKNPADDRQTLENRSEFTYLGLETYNGRKVHLYSKLERKKKLNTSNGTTSESESAVKIHISTDGKYYRYESNAKTLGARGTAGDIRIVIEVEADPTITIKAPETSK